MPANLTFSQCSPGHAGNWGLNAQNGGNALGTSSFVLQAGSYPEIYSDYKKTVAGEHTQQAITPTLACDSAKGS